MTPNARELLARHEDEDGELVGPAAGLAAAIRAAWNELRWSDVDLGDYDDIIETLIRLGAAVAVDTDEHFYISTACLHAANPGVPSIFTRWLHVRCRKECKWCPAQCRCACHSTKEAA